VGIAAYVFTIEINQSKYVIKFSETKKLINGSIYWLNKLHLLDLPIPKIHSVNIDTSPYYFIMSYIPGKDLGLVYSSLSKEQKRTYLRIFINIRTSLEAYPLQKVLAFFIHMKTKAILERTGKM